MDDEMEDGDEDGRIELFEGDVSMILRADGELEVVVAITDESSEEYSEALRVIELIRFALNSPECHDLFDKRVIPPLDLN
jgi:hypothetical protein